MKGGYVYILTNKRHNVLYTGVTSNLYARIYQHRQKLYHGFTKRYNCTKLVYWESHEDIAYAIHREKRIKKYTRLMKVELIRQFNPEWNDLYDSISEMQ